MKFTLDFLEIFGQAVVFVSPLLAFFCLVVLMLGQVVGRIEGWSKFNALYWAFITAFTVGYGDLRPSQKTSKVLSIVIALLGIMFTGIIVAVTVAAATTAFNNTVVV